MRIWQSGWENAGAGVEFTAVSGSPTTSAVVVNSGTKSGSIPSLTSATAKSWSKQAVSSGATLVGPLYIRFYLNVATSPSAANTIFSTGGGISVAGCIKLTSTRTLQLFNTTTQVGSDSAALNANQWYRIEMLSDKSGAGGSHILTALIDGVQFASASNLTLADGIHDIIFGGNLKSEAQTVAGWFFDDAAINDNTGTDNKSYPGALPVAIGNNNYLSIDVPDGMSMTEKIR